MLCIELSRIHFIINIESSTKILKFKKINAYYKLIELESKNISMRQIYFERLKSLPTLDVPVASVSFSLPKLYPIIWNFILFYFIFQNTEKSQLFIYIILSSSYFLSNSKQNS